MFFFFGAGRRAGGVAVGFLICGIAAAAAAPEWRTVRHEHVLGTALEMKFAAPGAAAAEAAERAALAEVDRLAGILSGYDAASEFSRWSATPGGPTRVSPELAEVLGLFDRWRDRTGGALDAAAESAGRLWRQAARTQQLPTAADLEAVVAAVRATHWRLDAAAGMATRLTATPLRLNSFAKGYILDRAADAARATPGVMAVVINIGGDLVVRGAAEETVAVADPLADAENDPPLTRLAVRDRAVATSGGYRRGVEIGGRWYSHLIDPRTGRPVEHVRSATVVAASATDAGALATALCVLAPEEGLRLAATVPGAECLLVLADGRVVRSPGWNAAEQAATGGRPVPAGVHAAVTANGGPVPAAASAAKPPAAVWDPAWELGVKLEIASVGGGRAKRPFVAVWIEDADKFPVRTLALWYHGARWLPDLRAWNSSDHVRAMAEGTKIVDSVSSATRGPGAYTLKWDGKDGAGQPVRRGRYTVLIEVAREHGTHQIVRGEIDVGDAAQHVDLPANVELAAAALDYRRKAATR